MPDGDAADEEGSNGGCERSDVFFHGDEESEFGDVDGVIDFGQRCAFPVVVCEETLNDGGDGFRDFATRARPVTIAGVFEENRDGADGVETATVIAVAEGLLGDVEETPEGSEAEERSNTEIFSCRTWGDGAAESFFLRVVIFVSNGLTARMHDLGTNFSLGNSLLFFSLLEERCGHLQTRNELEEGDVE